MSNIDYAAPATVHLGDEPNVRGSQQLVLSNFSTTAEAIKFVVEHLPRDLEGTCIMSAGQRLSGDRIARLYASNAFPLERRSRQSAAREAEPAPTGSRADAHRIEGGESRAMNDNDRPRALTETERRVLEAARDADAWVPILDLDRVRRLGAGDIATVPSLIDAGFLAHDPGTRAIQITDAGRHALE